MNGIVARQNFELAYNVFAKAGLPNLDRTRLTMSTLRMEQPLAANTNLYQFPVLINIQTQQQAFATERRLQLQDSFVVTEVGIFLGLPTSSTDVAWIPDTYPNPFKYANATQMQAIYNNGIMSCTIDNDRWITNWDVLRHYVANQTQQTAAAGAGSPIDQNNAQDDGMYPCQPMVFLTGAQNIDLNITLPRVAPTAVDANSRLIIIFRGVLAQNSTVIQ